MNRLHYLSGILMLMIWSCKAMQPPQPVMKPMPSSFDESGDSSTEIIPSWKVYFSDRLLINLIDTAIHNNWDLLMAAQRIQAASADLLFAKGILKPTVNAVAAAGISKFGAYTMNGAGNKGTPIYNGKDIPTVLPDYFLGLQTSWEMDLWGKLQNKKKAAVSRFFSTVEGRNLVLTNLVADISSAYYELLALDQALHIIDENIILQENALEIVKVQKEAAVTNELAVQQFKAQLLHLRSMRYETLQGITASESRINFLAGRYPQPVLRDSLFFTNAIPQKIKPGIPAALLQNRPDIKQAELELVASKADVQSARAAFYPSLNISGLIGFQAYKTGLLFTTAESLAYGFLGSLAAPIINRSAIKAEFSRANANQLTSLYHYQKTVMNGFLEVYNELNKIKNLQQVVELKTNAADVLTLSIQTAAELFRTGRANYLEVLFAQQSALQVRLELVDSKKYQLLSTVNLYKALGGGWR